jgi:hypothetical protein
MPTRSSILFATLAVTAALAAPAGAAITLSPVKDPNNGFPFSYTDANGLALTLCMDNSGNCFVVTPAPNPLAPLPDSFTPDGEAFYFDADATMPNAGTGVVRFAQEAAFVNPAGDIVNGDQGVFNRVRFRFQTLTPGATYRVSHPWGINEVTADGLGIVNDTTDVGCVPGTPPPCDFAASTAGAVNQWVTAVSPAPPAGYVGSFARAQTITPGPTGLNVVRLEKLSGPGGLPVQLVGETNQFNISGKLAGAAPAPAPSLGISTAALQFKSRQAGTTSAPQSVTVTNFGTAPGTVTGMSVTGAEAADFVVSQNTCTAPLAPQASCTANVAFAPTAAGDRAATLSIANDAPAGARTIGLSGSALPAPSTTTVVVAPLTVAAPAPLIVAPVLQPKLALKGHFFRSRQRLATIRRKGLRVAVQVPAGTRVLKLAVYRAVNGKASGPALHTLVRLLGGREQELAITLTDGKLRKQLKSGRYLLVVVPGTQSSNLGVPASLPLTVIR